MQYKHRETDGRNNTNNKNINKLNRERENKWVERDKSEMLRENLISSYSIIAAPGGCCH